MILQKYQQQVVKEKTSAATQSASQHGLYFSPPTSMKKHPVNIISNLINYMLSISVSMDEKFVAKSLKEISSLISKIDSAKFIVAKTIVEAIENFMNSYSKLRHSEPFFNIVYRPQKNKILAILKFPAWCSNICEYYTKKSPVGDEIISFEQLSSTEFYAAVQKIFNSEPEFMQFKKEFDQMVKLAKNPNQGFTSSLPSKTK